MRLPCAISSAAHGCYNDLRNDIWTPVRHLFEQRFVVTRSSLSALVLCQQLGRTLPLRNFTTDQSKEGSSRNIIRCLICSRHNRGSSCKRPGKQNELIRYVNINRRAPTRSPYYEISSRTCSAWNLPRRQHRAPSRMLKVRRTGGGGKVASFRISIFNSQRKKGLRKKSMKPKEQLMRVVHIPRATVGIVTASAAAALEKYAAKKETTFEGS